MTLQYIGILPFHSAVSQYRRMAVKEKIFCKSNTTATVRNETHNFINNKQDIC